MRILWQILVAITERDPSVWLTCNECLRFMEHTAEAAIAETDQASLRKVVKDHLSICLNYLEHILSILESMEDNLSLNAESR